MPARDRLMAIAVAVIWGVNFIAIRWGLDDVAPLVFVAVRFTFVALPLVFLVPRPKVSWRVVAAVGTFMSLGQFGLLYVAMDQGMPAGLAALVLQAQVVFTILLAWIALGEVARRRQIFGVVIGSIGLAVVALGFGADASVLPLLITVGAAASWAVGNVVARAAKVTSGLSLVVWSALVVPLPSLALLLLVDGWSTTVNAFADFTWTAIGSTAFTVVVSTLIGYTWFNILLSRHPAASVMPYILLVTPVGMMAAWLVLHETPGYIELIGAAVMLAGVAIASVVRTTTAPTAPSASTIDASVPR